MILILLTVPSCFSTKETFKEVAVFDQKEKLLSVKQNRFVQIKTSLKFTKLSSDQKKRYCSHLERAFRKYNWDRGLCSEEDWFTYGNSAQENPLVFMLWGDDQEKKAFEYRDVTLIMCGVHGDEITPVKFCYDILQLFKEESLKSDQLLFKNRTIVLAPLVNPDAFFKKLPTRTNANGVDINRNFPTRDWDGKALKLWRRYYKKDKRRYPGPKANSEPETKFQVTLIRTFKPHKIISVHAPLTMLDYDGPESLHTGGLVGQMANQLLIQMSKSANGYRIKNYPFFTGSLGNYAGNERNIPTFTFELPSSDNRNHKKYWSQFRGIIVEAINHTLQTKKSLKERPVVDIQLLKSEIKDEI